MTSNATQQGKPANGANWTFFCFVTASGLLLAFLLSFRVALIGNPIYSLAFLGFLDGAIIGFVQWRIVRHFVDLSQLFIPASSIGLGVGLTLGYIIAFGGHTGFVVIWIVALFIYIFALAFILFALLSRI